MSNVRLLKIAYSNIKIVCIFPSPFCAFSKSYSIEPPDVWDNYDKTLNSLPKDASRTLDLAVNCYHLSGEINGDRSQNDKETIRTMNKLHCDKVEKKVSAIKSKYKNNKSVLEAFKIYHDYENE